VIKILSKHFGDPYETIFVSQVSFSSENQTQSFLVQEVLSPKPCAKINDDYFVIHLDFVPVAKTDDCSTALALIIALYSIFEIQFGSHNRAIRLLYGVLLQESDALDKRIRVLLSSWSFPVQQNGQTVVRSSLQLTTQIGLPQTSSKEVIDSLSVLKSTVRSQVQ
jgi:hypothetical protein